jgi:division protein CdvB (Snf7/Vps24/ESCRT-III family)
MTDKKIDLAQLAREIAEIARTTKDPDTARQLLELVEMLLREAGLPP